jgi:endo-1,4-beta-D-glucanase Y
VKMRRLLLLGLLSTLLAACGSTRAAVAPARESSRGSSAGASPVALADEAARSFLQTYVDGDGRVVRRDQGGDTVSEGQAYGMLMAAAVGERSRFSSIWSWTQRNLQQPTGLFAFHWSGGRVSGPQPATDADLEISRALLLGACRWNDTSLREAAAHVARGILAHETARAGSLDVLLAGPWAHKGNRLVFNPSYVDPEALYALARLTGDSLFGRLAASGTQLVNELTRPLPPDWANVSTVTGQPTPVSSASSPAGPGLFTFDAPRALAWFGADSRAASRAAVARAWDVFKQTAPQDIVTEHQLSGAVAGSDHNPVTLVAVAGAAKAAGAASSRVEALLDQAAALNRQHPTYYGAAWLALGRLLLSTDQLVPCG